MIPPSKLLEKASPAEVAVTIGDAECYAAEADQTTIQASADCNHNGTREPTAVHSEQNTRDHGLTAASRPHV